MRYCKNCGKEVTSKDKTCPHCGWDFKSRIDTNLYGTAPSTTNAVIFSILSIILGLLPLVGVPLGIIGIVMGKRDLDKRSIVLGIIGLVISVISTTVWAVLGLL